MERIVCKFGGTSLADAGQILKVAAIVRADPKRRYVVVSAPGKRHRDDQKVTDLLLTCCHLATQRLQYQEPLGILRDRYHAIASELGVTEVHQPMAELERELQALAAGQESLATTDWVAARGEYFTAVLVAEYLGARFVPSGECIVFDEEGRLDPVSYQNLQSRMQDDALYVIPGFYGRDRFGRIKTFPRGGSDITGAVVARAVQAQLYENWTDVSGLLMADPRIVAEPRVIEQITYRELRELAYMGASVLHEDTIFPASQAAIPIRIKNTNQPQDPGTLIVQTREDRGEAVVGVAGRTGFTAIYIEKAMMNQQRGFGRRVLEILEAHGVSYEHIPSGIDSMSIIVADEQFQERRAAVLRELERTLETERIETYSDLALIATVGNGMAYRVGVAGHLFQALRDARVNVRMITQGASEINIIVGVSTAQYQDAVRAIYTAFLDWKP